MGNALTSDPSPDYRRGESAGGEACPCGGGRVWGEGSLLAKRPVHAGEGQCGRRGVSVDENFGNEAAFESAG